MITRYKEYASLPCISLMNASTRPVAYMLVRGQMKFQDPIEALLELMRHQFLWKVVMNPTCLAHMQATC